MRGADLIWPLVPPHVLKSSFGEYREGGRVHAGIDFSTGGKTGLAVRAAGEGEVFRLKVEWRGYGRAIYQRLADGRILVYAHLERFVLPGLEEALRRARISRGRYPGDIEVSPPLSVRRGDLLALSGESGAGFPHLHFEVRTPENEPADPQGGEGFPAIPDSDPPVFEALWVETATPDAWVNGAARTQRLEARRVRKGEWEAGPVKVSGGVDLAVELYDPSSEEGRLGVTWFAVRWDGRGVSSIRPRTFPFSAGRRIAAMHDAAHCHLAPSRFAYRPLGWRGSPWSEGDPPTRLEGAPGTTHTLEIEARDAAGNAAVLRAVLEFTRVEEIVKGTSAPEPGGAANFWPVRPEEAAWHEGTLFLPLGPRGREGEASRRFRLLPAAGARALSVSRWESAGHSPIAAAEVLKALLPPGGAILYQMEGSRILLRGRQARIDRSGLKVECGEFQLRLPPAALPPGTAVSVQEQDQPAAPGWAREISPAVRIEPASRVPQAPARLRFQYDASRVREARLGVYRWDSVRRRWTHAGGTGEARRGVLEIEAGELGTFRLLEDNEPPVWGENREFVAAERLEAGRWGAQIELEDAGSGIFWESVAAELDGRAVEADYDPDRKRLEARALASPPAGEHSLRLKARDRAGNEATPLEWRFQVEQRHAGE